MHIKTICKIVVDIVMTVLMIGLMAYLLIGEAAHEWMGMAVFVLFVIHHALNWQWHKTILKGRYTPFRVFQVVLDILILLSMAGAMVSGIMMSQEVFPFLNITHGMAFARILHMLTSYWGFLFISMHIGMHWDMMKGIVRKIFGIRKNIVVRTVILRVLAVMFVVYGCYVFVRNDIASYMFLRTQFVFFDLGQPLVVFFGEYVAMPGMWAIAGYYTGRLLKRFGQQTALKKTGGEMV